VVFFGTAALLPGGEGELFGDEELPTASLGDALANHRDLVANVRFSLA